MPRSNSRIHDDETDPQQESKSGRSGRSRARRSRSSHHAVTRRQAEVARAAEAASAAHTGVQFRHDLHRRREDLARIERRVSEKTQSSQKRRALPPDRGAGAAVVNGRVGLTTSSTSCATRSPCPT